MKDGAVELFDITGRSVASLDVINREIDLSYFTAGCYVFHFQRSDKSIGSLKLIKE